MTTLPNPSLYEFRTDDGRVCWPAVMQYLGADGTQSNFPRASEAYRVNVLKLPEYDVLSRTGRLIDPRHTGVEWADFVDMRSATQ